MPITAQESTFVDLADGIYPAQLAEWEEGTEGQWGPTLKLVWSLSGLTKDDGSPQDKWQFCSQKLTPKSTLNAICRALGFEATMGQTYELDELLDPLVGRPAQLVIKTVDGPKGPRSQVTDILPANVGKAPAKPAARQAPAAAAQQRPAATPGADVCKVYGCGGVVDHYTGRGTPLCAAHTAEDL